MGASSKISNFILLRLARIPNPNFNIWRSLNFLDNIFLKNVLEVILIFPILGTSKFKNYFTMNKETPATRLSTNEQEPTQQTACEPQTPVNETPANTSEPSTSDSWNFYNQLQTIEPNESHGGSNHTNSHLKQYRKRRNKQRTQRNSRRINRKH